MNRINRMPSETALDAILSIPFILSETTAVSPESSAMGSATALFGVQALA